MSELELASELRERTFDDTYYTLLELLYEKELITETNDEAIELADRVLKRFYIEEVKKHLKFQLEAYRNNIIDAEELAQAVEEIHFEYC